MFKFFLSTYFTKFPHVMRAYLTKTALNLLNRELDILIVSYLVEVLD